MTEATEPGDRQYEMAWRALSEPLSWMQGNAQLAAYWGWNLADIANDLIDRAYPGLRSHAGASYNGSSPTIGSLDARLTLAAGAIIDRMTGGKFDWRSRVDDGDFLSSADWMTALEYARAALDASGSSARG